MRIVIVGQQAFGKAVLEAFIARGDDDRRRLRGAGEARRAARPAGRRRPRKRSCRSTASRNTPTPRRRTRLRELNADIGVMAYVLLFAPPEFCAIPKHGMIQFHPSLLPLHRGPASIPWAIIRGRSETGLTIFRPTPGLDEGPVILQKRVAIGPDDTAASLYFDKIFPLGVEALVQAADLVVAGRATEWTQDESQATYEGWVREAEVADQLGQPCRFRLRPDPRLQPGARAPGRFSNPSGGENRRAEALSVRRQEDHGADLRHGARQEDRRGRVRRPEGMRILAQGGFIECSRAAPRRRRQGQIDRGWISRSGRFWAEYPAT